MTDKEQPAQNESPRPSARPAQPQAALNPVTLDFRAIADFTWDWEFWLDRTRRYAYVSSACERMAGYSPDDFMRAPGLFLELVGPDFRSAVQAAFERAFAGRAEPGLEFCLLHRDGGWRWLSLACQPAGRGDGLLGVRGSIRDITARRMAEAAADERAAELNAIFAALLDPVLIHDRTGRVVRWNQGAVRDLGLPVEGAEGLPAAHGQAVSTSSAPVQGAWLAGIAPGQAPGLTLRYLGGQPVDDANLPWRRALQGQTISAEHYLVRDPDGRERVVLISAAPIVRRGEISGAVATWRDISDWEALLAENLSQSHMLQQLLDSAPVSVAVLRGPEHRIDLVNAAFVGLTRRRPEEVLGLTLAELWPQQVPFAVPVLEQVYATGRAVSVQEMRAELEPEAPPAYWNVDCVPLTEAGYVAGVLVLTYDVTSLVQARQTVERAKVELEARVEERTAELSHREAALAEANAALRYQADLLARVNDAVLAVNPGMCITAWNHAAEQMFGWQEAEVLGRPLAEVLPMEPVGETREHILEQVDHGASWRGEVIVRHRAGTSVHVEATAVAVYDAEGRVVGRVAVNRDITARVEAQEQVRRQAERAQALVRTAERLNAQLRLEAVLDTVCEEAAQALQAEAAWINLYNAGHDALEYATSWGMPPAFGAGYTPSPKPLFDDYAGRMGRVLVFPDVQEVKGIPNERLYAALDIRTVANATMQHEGQLVGVLSVVSFGQVRYFSEDELLLLQGLAHQAALAIANARLFAEVRSGREQLKTLSHHLVAIQEEERKNLSRELHDRAGQSMTSLKLRLAVLRRNAANLPGLQAQLDELRELADTVMEDLHELAVNLRPTSLDRSGLVPALEQLVNSFRRQEVVAAQLLLSGLADDRGLAASAGQPRLPEDVETALYRIVQEALTNVVRHAQAGQVGVILNWRAERVSLIVEDDGQGFDVEDALQRGRLGLLGMRERAEMVGGTLTIESAPGIGTTVYVDVPLQAENA